MSMDCSMPSTSFQHSSMRLQHNSFSFDRRLQHDQQHRQRRQWFSPRLRHCLRVCAEAQDSNAVSEGVKRGDFLRAVAGAATSSGNLQWIIVALVHCLGAIALKNN
jgi:hypothetical protein